MKLKELRTRKYVALIMMIVIIGTIVGILKIGNMDFDKGKVKVSKAVINNVTSSLSANINEAAVDNLITSKGYDEIDYVIKYSLSTDENIKERNVIIEASLDDNEKYASFKDITNGDVTSTVSENRKNIKITVKNAKVNKENELKLVMKLEGAPNEYKVTPKIKIKEVSEEKYTNLNVQNVEVKNNSLTGNVQDEQSMNVSNIELALKKDGETIKKTYTDEDGNYVFSDIEEGKYDLEIDEDIYEKVSEEKVNVSGSSKLNIVVKEVTPYKIELKKQITEMTIVNGGNATTYKYGNLDKVQQALRNVKNMTGEVKYKITVQNTGKKSGVVTVVKDEVPEGLTFNKEKNTSWEEKNGVLYNRSLEGITLNAGEKREEGLTLDIESTSEAKTYINKVTAKGEIYENIVYILDGKTYKEDTVLEGEKIKEPKVDNKDFKGWYTDKKYTNKYNFNNEVTKDLVLYGQTEEIKEYTVTYVDNEKIVKTEKVKENGSLTAPKVSKEGHTFKYWSEEPNGKEYDLNTKVTKDITLYSVYDINKYTVTFINGKEKYDEQQVEYGGNIKVPTSPLKKYYTFKYWSLEENGDSYDLNTKVTKDITLYSVYDINKYTVTFIDKGKEINKQELEAGSVLIAPKVSMEGYKFKYWSEKENGKEYNLNLPITRNLTLYSVYEINKYNVEFYDSNKLIKTIKVDYDNTINSNEVPTVSKIGYTFTGWIENNKNFDFTTKIKENKKLYSKYEIIKNAVIFNDENRITTKKVDYNNKVEKIESQGKTGYTFKYWSTTQDGEEFDFNTLITESITLYAVYEINEYSVNFIDQGNVYGDTQRVKYNNVAVKPETDPIKEGYTFKYWSLEENGAAYDFNTKITKDITLYSVYSVNNYKVSFVDNGTKYIEDETIEYNKAAIKPETDPSKVGHTFKYWSLEENGVAYDFNTKITKDITLYSVYSVNSYKVSFINEGTKYIEDENIEYNKVALKPETDPSKVGHTFKYWSLGENGIAYDFSTKITKDTTLYSVYEANEYTVKFMNGDNLFKQEQVKYGLKATKPSENPTMEHNLFKTWTLNDKEYDFNLPVTDNLVLHSKYEEIEKPSISHVPTEWTNNKVTVTITSSHEDYKYLYKIDTGEYKEYTGTFDIDYNCTVVAKSVKENVDSITESHDITNIDKIKPIINSLNETNVSGTSFDINVSTIDNESGMKQIHIYKDDLLETTIVYNENYNEEKNSTYTFNDLTSGNDYKIKVIAEDVAGNLSEAKEITVKTEEKIVARIIGRENKLFEDENLYENFSSLERAINACPSNQCTIEMVTDTKESVEVLEGQDITLNINGKTITGVKDTYTINNGGNLIIKDNVEETGSIVNNAGVALKNETTGVLTLGELEDELVVSTTKPYINGGTFGVVNEYIDKNTKGRFNFYDGMIAGNIAIEGEVNDKPYLYNASVVTSDNRQVATLKILEDAEARIIRTGVYYTKVNEAIEDTNKGTFTEPTTTNTTLMNGFKTNTMYGFTYDSETNTLSSESNRTSKSYTTIDLTGYENDQYLYITSKELSSTYGNFSITVKENDSNGTSINQTKTYDNTTGQNNYKFTLSKGKRYYVELIYKINSETENNKVVISNISLQKINRYGVTEDTEFKSLSNTYSFEYDEATRTLRSNNQYTKYTTAFSYIEVDLTNEQEDKEVIINASLDTLSYSNYGNIVINEDNSKLSSSSSSALAYMYVNGYSNTSSSQTFVGPYNYSKRLEKGKKYYIQFYYFKGYDNYSESKYKEYDSKDQFIINTIDIVGVGNKEDIDLSTNLKTNYYGFDNYDSYYNSYSVQNNAPSGEKFDSYVKIDLTKSKVDQMIDLNLKLNNYSSIYITSNNKDSGKDLIINNMNNTLLSFYLNYDYYINGNSHWSSFYDYKYVLPKGSVYYVHFAGYNPDGKSGASIKSISLIPVTDNMINIGTLPHLKGTIDDSNKPADTNLSYVTNDGTKDANFRFVGNNTKNYVKFNNELWRAIGIFNTTDSDGNYAKRIKLIRDKSLYQDLNIYLSWDSSDSSINNGTGINEWSQADLMKLLNPGYENNAPNNIYSEDTKCKKGEKENPDLPKYIVDDTIYFDPVKYRICDSESDSCPAWTVMSGNNCTGEYELVYKKSDVYDYSKAIESNGGSYDNVLINYLNKISETWSDKIISPSSESNMNSLFDFTKSKARILNTKELSEKNLSQKLSICASSYIASSSCNYPILVMSENNYYFLVNKNVLNQNFPFSNANYSLSINPVIKIDLNKVENKSDFIGKEKANTLKLNNSLYWTGKSGYCFIGSGEYNTQCDFSSIGLSNSAKSMIDSVVWNTGALPNDYDTRKNLTALEVYAMERGNNNGKTNMNTTSNSYDTVNRTTSWIGKVGLPYASDYILSAGNGSSYTRDECIKGNSNKYANCVSYNSWLNSTNTDGNSLTITPTYGGEYPSNVASIYTSIYSYPAYSSSTIKPTVYLSPKVKITSGNGTQDDPFILELGEEENKTLYYGLVPDLIKDDNKEEETEISDEAETLDYTYVKKEAIYGFTYDEERGVFTNDNKGIANTTAISYIKIDLTNAASDMPINLSYKLSKSDYDSMGFLHLMKNNLNKINYNDSTSYSKGDTIFASGAKSYSDTKAITLEKGNVYYLQFAYKKEGKLPVSSTNEDKFEVGITYSTNNDITDDYTKYDESVPTLNKESDTVQILKDLLLTNSLNIENTRSMILDLNGHVISTVVDDYVIKNSGDLTVIDSKYYSDVEDQDKADANKQIEYNNEYKNSISKYSNSNYSYTINDYEKNGLKVNLDGIEHGDDATSWKDSSENNNTGIINGSAEFGTNYLNFDGVDDYIDLGKHNYENITFETVLDGNTGKIKTILYNMSNGGYQLRLSNLANSITFNYKSTATASRSLPTSFSKVIDKVYYAVTYDGEKIKTYVNGILVKTSSSKIYFADNDSSLLIGAGRNGTDLQNFYSGKIFTTRIYNRALTENEIEKNYLVDKNRYEFSNRGLTSSSTTATSDSGVDAYKAFDSDTNTSWYSESNDEASITYSSAERTLLKFRIYGDTDKSMYPKSVELLGSKDGINYASVLISNLESKGLNEYNEIKISPDVNDSYKYFKWNLRNPGNKIAIGEIKLDFVDITRKIVTFKSSTLVPSGTISSSSNSVIYNESGANLNIKEGKITLTKSGNYNAITNLGNLSLGSLSIINSSATAIYNDTNSQATINSKSISSNQYGIYNNTDRNLTLDIGSISSSGYFIYNSGGGKLDVSAKTVNTTNGIYNTGVEDSTINVITSNDKNDFLYNIGSGKIDLHAKTISGNIQNNAKGNIDAEILSKANKISNNDDGVINIKADAATVSGGIYNNGSGNITAAVSILNQGLYNEKIGNITATIGKIESKNIGIENVDAGTVDATIDTIRITKNSKDSTGNAYGIINSGTGVITANVSTISLNASRTMGQNRAVYNVKSGNIYLDAKTISLSNIATGSVRGSIASVGIYNASKGLIEVKNAEIIVKDTSGGGSYYGNAAIYSGSSGTINFFNGTITGCFNYGIWNSSTGVVDLGDKFDMDIYEQGIKNERGTIKIKNGNITSANKVVENNSGNISIDDSVFKNSSNVSDLIIYNLYGTITINNSSMPGTVDNNGSGTITINNGKVNGYIYNKGTFNINSGKHSVVDLDNGGGVTNSGKLTITDATLNGSVDNSGILNINNSTLESYFNDAITTSGTVNITKGKIIGGYGGIRAFDGTVTLGQKDGVVDKESVIIRGATFGIYDNGDGSNENYAKFNFYDGVITGKSNKAIDAAISDAEDGYDLYSYTNSDNSDLVDITLEIPNKETLGDVAEVDGVKYPSVKSAFDSISSEENKTIKLLKDTSTILNIGESNKNIKLDTNGKKIRYYSDKEYIINHNSLEISDINANKTAGIYSVYSTIVDNYGSLSVKGVNADYLTSKKSTIKNNDSCIVNIDAGVSSKWNAINNTSTGIVNVNSGTISSSSSYGNTIKNENGTINIKKVTVSSSKNSIENNLGEVNIMDSDANISGNLAIHNISGTVKMINGKVTGTIGIKNDSNGNLIIENGTIESVGNGIESSGKLQMNSGSISAQQAGIYLSDNSLSTINGGTIIPNRVGQIGINVSGSSILNINDGSVTGFGKGILVDGTLNLGTKGDIDSDGMLVVSKDSPNITASDIAIDINSNGIFNFYDGRITGKTAISGSVNEIEDNYQIILERNTSNDEIKYLDKKMIVKNLTTEEEYNDLQKAINDASSKDTLQLINSVTFMSSDEINISNDKNIILDLNGKEIYVSGSSNIKNLGGLKIIDSTNKKNTDGSVEYGNGKIVTLNKKLFENSGELILDAIVLSSGDNGTGSLIMNDTNGSLSLVNSKITTSSSSLIYNNSDNELNIENSIIDIKGEYILYNNSSSDININSSNITAKCNISECRYINNLSTGSITIEDSTISTNGQGSSIYNENGYKIDIKNSTISTSDKNYIIYNIGGSIINLTGSKLNTPKRYSWYSLYNEADNTINIKSSTLKSLKNQSSSSVVNVFSGEITYIGNSGTLNVGTESTSEDAVEDSDNPFIRNVENSGVLNFYSGTLNNDLLSSDYERKILLSSSSEFNMYGGTIIAYSDVAINASNKINLYNGTIKNSNGIGIKLTGENTKLINENCVVSATTGVEVTKDTTATIENIIINNSTTGIVTYKNSTLNLKNSTITTTDGYAIDNSGVLTVESGNIESINSTGIYNNFGTISIGIKGDKDSDGNNITSITNPSIKGKDYGINSKSAFDKNISFYDGVIKGEQDLILIFNEIETNYDVFITTDSDNNKAYYLKREKLLKNLSTNKEYYDLQDAIDESSDGDTLQFIRSKKYYQYNIPSSVVNEDKDIILDINGNVIETSGYYNEYITNNGKLKIIDSKNSFDENGIITSGTGKIYHDQSISMSGGDIVKRAALIVNYGTLDISGGLLESANESNILGFVSGSITLNSGGITGKRLYSNQGTSFNINGGKIDVDIISGPTSYNIKSGTINSSDINTYNTVNIYGGTINSTNINVNTMNMLGGIITSNITGNTINISDGTVTGTIKNFSKLNVGIKDAIVNTTTPSITNVESEYTVNGVNKVGEFNFYDGKIVSIKGRINEVQPGYKVVNSDGYNILMPLGDDERVAMVNGINFGSLQAAINSVKDNTESNIVIYKDIELTEDIIVPENKIINLYLNGHTITYGDYNFVKNGTLTIIDSAPSDSIGASIINTIEKVLNINQNGKNIIVYEMSDGSKLSTENTYNLYKKVDNEYKLLNMEKDEEVGRYITGSNNSEMTSIKGRIYLNNLEEGSYKLVSSDNKDIEFTITEDGKLNGNILENTNEKRKVIETAFAYLIITIQTGVNQIKYIIYIVAIVSIILGLYFAFKEQKKLSRKV